MVFEIICLASAGIMVVLNLLISKKNKELQALCDELMKEKR